MDYDTEYISREILRRLGYTNLKPGDKAIIRCPNPYHEDKKPSCSVSLSKGVGHCFSCNYSFNLRSLYRERFGHSINSDLGISQPLSLELQEQYAPDFDATPETDFDIKGRFYRPDITDASKRWIEKRGFDVNLLEMLKVKYLKYGISKPISDPNNKDLWMTISDRIIIPIYEKKTMISFEARDLYDKEHWIKKLGDKIDPETWAYKKVLYPRFSSVNTLYRFNELKKNEKLYVVEGLMDVISLLTHPLFQNSTCTFGAGITERQFYLLSQFKEICIIPNNDAPGLNVVRLFKNKPHIKNVTVLTLPKILKDVNDVLQKKTKHKSIDDLVKGQWTRWEKDLCNFDIDEYYRSL